MSAPSSTPTDQDVAVVAEGLVKTFGGGVRALDGVSLKMPRGRLAALVGANGSGKSTLLRTLFGAVRPDAGSLRVLGHDPTTDAARLRPLMGYASQDAALDPEMTGREMLRLFDALRGLPRRDRSARMEAIAAEHGLESFRDRLIGTYSGGQRRRLHLALETMHAPRLLLLDEPTAGLDPSARRALWSRLGALRDAGVTVLAATHDLEDVAAHCDHAFLMAHGSLLASGAPARLVAEHCRAVTLITLAAPTAGEGGRIREALRALDGNPEISIDEFTVTIARDEHPAIGEPALDALALAGIAYRRYERRDPDLAGVYFRLSGTPIVPAAPLNAQEGRGKGTRGGGGRGGAGRGSNGGGNGRGGTT